MTQEEIKILERCERLFMRYGAKSITMDDVSRELGISKKTLYQYVAGKEDLVYKVTQFHFKHHDEMVNRICNNSTNAIDEMLQITQWVSHHLQEVNPSLMFDLNKYYPDSWQLFLDHRNTQVYNCLINNIQKGRAQELYRTNFNEEIVCRIYISRLDMVIDPTVFPFEKFRLRDVMQQYVEYHIRGIATTKGIKKLEKTKPTTL
ncbi:MAG: TetR/AcrR family transcriptional regulator [Chitinophagales bacterium]